MPGVVHWEASTGTGTVSWDSPIRSRVTTAQSPATRGEATKRGSFPGVSWCVPKPKPPRQFAKAKSFARLASRWSSSSLTKPPGKLNSARAFLGFLLRFSFGTCGDAVDVGANGAVAAVGAFALALVSFSFSFFLSPRFVGDGFGFSFCAGTWLSALFVHSRFASSTLRPP